MFPMLAGNQNSQCCHDGQHQDGNIFACFHMLPCFRCENVVRRYYRWGKVPWPARSVSGQQRREYTAYIQMEWNTTISIDLRCARKFRIHDVLSGQHKSAGTKKSFWENVAKSVSGTPSVSACEEKWKALQVQYEIGIGKLKKKRSISIFFKSIRYRWRQPLRHRPSRRRAIENQ